jgi:hypothetical protein
MRKSAAGNMLNASSQTGGIEKKGHFKAMISRKKMV